jgi:hypothetical protein
MVQGAGSEPDESTVVSSQPASEGQSRKRVLGSARAWRRWLLLVFPAIVFIVLVILSFPDLANAFSGSVTQVNCPPPALTPGKSVQGSAGIGSLAAKLRPGQREEVDFGRSMGARSVTLDLDLSRSLPRPTRFHVIVNPFTRADDASLQDPGRNIVASAVSDERLLLLNVCFKRSGNRQTTLGDPGSYTGSVTIDDSRLVAPVTVPITVTMQFPNGVFLIWLFAGVIIPGAWCLWVIKDKPTSTDNALGPNFVKWLITINGVVAVVSGSVAAFAVYVAVYLRNPTWDGSALRVLTLYGSMFSAFVTTAGIASLTGGNTASSDPSAGQN